ncbi:MAG: GGDEF domain-containing protein [Lachnospiraceae bacterium]|nr:GGDEF domain-containing protein [Lachnospiraceae bacterium]
MEGMNIVPEEELIKYPVTYKWGKLFNWTLLAIHFILLVVFGLWGAWIIALVNCVSLLVYIKLLGVIKDYPDRFFLIVFAEIVIHMVAATICVGWDSCFYIYTIGVIPFGFFSDYMSRKDGAKGFNPLVLTAMSGLAYLVERLYTLFNPAIYNIDKSKVEGLGIVNMVMVGAFLTISTYVFINSILDNESELMDVAEYDALTELGNRHRIDRTMPLYGIDVDCSKKLYSTAILDIDNFKKVNDNFGHLAGDQVLRDIARILRHYESSDVFVFRWGGEEFMIIVIGDDSYSKLMELCEKVRCDVAGNVSIFDYFRIVVTISSGVAECCIGEAFKDLTERADKCLYQAKGNGKNQVVGAKDIGLQ